MYRKLAILTVLTALGCDAGDCPEGNLGCSEEAGGVSGDSAASSVVGEWELTYVAVARDAVNRPVDAAEVTWNLEIFKAVRNEFTGLYDVSAVFTGGSLCAVSTLNFEQGLPGCTPIGLTLPGRCGGHTCTHYVDQVVTGRFDAASQTFAWNRHTLEAFTADDEFGYVEVTAILDHDALPADGTQAPDCADLCVVNVEPDGGFAGNWPAYHAETRRSSFRKLTNSARRADPDAATERTVPVGDGPGTSELLLGDYTLRVLVYQDEDQVRSLLGELTYGLEIFEVNPIGTVGDYQWFGALEAGSVCWAEVAGGQCRDQGPASLGRCASTCTREPAYAVNGFYDEFTGQLRINRVDASMYAGDNAGFFAVALTLLVQGDSQFDEEGLDLRECDDVCYWTATPGGENAAAYPDPASGEIRSIVAEAVP